MHVKKNAHSIKWRIANDAQRLAIGAQQNAAECLELNQFLPSRQLAAFRLINFLKPLHFFNQKKLMMPLWIQAAIWGFITGLALLAGAAVAYFVNVPSRIIAAIMAFGSGVLISALSFELMDEAYRQGGFYSTAIGFLSGAIVYTGANWILARQGAKHRKRSGELQHSEQEVSGSGLAIALGALLDGIPESIVIGLSLLKGGTVSYVAVVAIALSNVPEGLSSAAGMKKAGRSPAYIFTVWGSLCLLLTLASLAGFTLFKNFSPEVVSTTTAIAAGAILAMLVDTMIPEAFAVAHDFAGLITVAGFLVAFVLSKLAE